MSLSDNATALRIVAGCFGEAASDLTQREGRGETIDQTAFFVLCALENVCELAADRLKAADVAEALETAAAHRCSVDHSKLISPRCPACGGPK